MKTLIVAFWVFLNLFLTFPALADNVSFTFSIQNAPGGIGDFSWTVTTAKLEQSLDTRAWNAASNPSTGGGCKITRILLQAENQAYGFTTFFAPLCLGLYDSETSGIAVSPSEYGTYMWSGTNPDNTKSFETLTISKSDLPITAPEPTTLFLLLAGGLLIAGTKAALRERAGVRVLGTDRL